MTQPRDFGFTEEHAMLKQAARRFFHDKLPTQQLHKLVADEYAADRDPRAKWNAGLWQDIVQLGWPALGLPESCGGSNLPCVAAIALIEEAGFAAFPSPLLSTLQSAYLLKACAMEAAGPFMEGIVRGRRFTHSPLNLYGGDSGITAQLSGDNYILNGSARFVQDAQKSDVVIIRANASGRLVLFAVDLDNRGLAITPDHIVDLTRDQAALHVSQARIPASALLAEGQAAEDALSGAKPALLTLLAADMVGAGEWQLQTTVEYAKTRVQFDKPIGAFQAVKHPLVDLMIMLDGARALVYNAACAIDHEPEKALRYAHAAKAAASDMAAFASKKSVQLHGGIGFTWECFVHLYVKRQKHSQALYGDAMEHRRALAALVMDH